MQPVLKDAGDHEDDDHNSDDDPDSFRSFQSTETIIQQCDCQSPVQKEVHDIIEVHDNLKLVLESVNEFHATDPPTGSRIWSFSTVASIV